MSAALPVEEIIKRLADKYARDLKQRVDERVKEMADDDTSHYLIYRVLGVSTKEGELIDIYQNKGRFLYKYAGSFVEDAAKACFKAKFPLASAARITNTQGTRPKTFEIDCVVKPYAYEVKWRDATTDGDHITKEHTRLKAVCDAGYTPIRLMFYYPNRDQAIRIQKTLETLYKGANGQYHYGDAAWDHVHKTTGIDLKSIFEKLASSRSS